MIPAEPIPPPGLCQTCGTPLPGGKWSGACPRCLIEAFGQEEATDSADSLVAGYTILEEISRGGMGVVYRARQHHPSRIVALKMILPHLLGSPAIRARFQAEAESVAKLDHPNVLPIYEAGENRGTPYLTMKFVAGGSLAAHRARFLGAPQACAELVAAAARGVQHAHERGILHRDLKPANLLLDAPGPDAPPIPMVSDFGLARILEAEPSGLTAPSAFLGTAGYLAPELAFGGSNAPTVQTDIYSLGAILYELIAGQLPFGTATGLEALRRADRETPLSLRSLNPRIPKDLDAICLCCLQREPSSRYPSASALADDLDRFLAGSPVVAQKDTMSYRAAKFARRNKAGLAVAALVLLILVGGIIATSWQARIAMKEKARAERRFNEVRTLAHSVLFDYHDAIKNLPGATKVRERLVKDALNYLDSLAGDAQGDPALQRELAAAYERVGEVRVSLGDLAGALESATKALGIREALLALNPDDAEARRELASSHKQTGSRLLDTAKAATSLEHFRKALALYLQLTREEPGNDDLRLAFADMYNTLGQAMRQQGDLAGALEQFRTATAICEKLAASNPQEQRYRRVLWATLDLTADVHFLQRNVADAIAFNAKGLALGEALIAEDPVNADYRQALVANYAKGGDYRKLTDKQGALGYLRRAVALEEELVAADPANAETRKHLGYQHKRIADFLANMKDNSEALSHFRRAREILEKVASDAPEDLTSRFRVITYGAGVAGMQARLGEIDPALQECRKAIALLGETREEATNTKQRFHRAEAYQYLAYAFGALAASSKASTDETRRHRSTAREMFQECLNVLEDLRSRGALDPDSAEWAKEIAEEIAKCDAALGK
jgi:eukaryotic-like serine/threonine-protein kinase